MEHMGYSSRVPIGNTEGVAADIRVGMEAGNCMGMARNNS